MTSVEDAQHLYNGETKRVAGMACIASLCDPKINPLEMQELALHLTESPH